MVGQASTERHQVEDDNTEGNDDALTDLETINARQDVDGVGAEHGQEAHVDIVEHTKLDTVAQQPSEQSWHNNVSPITKP